VSKGAGMTVSSLAKVKGYHSLRAELCFVRPEFNRRCSFKVGFPEEKSIIHVHSLSPPESRSGWYWRFFSPGRV